MGRWLLRIALAPMILVALGVFVSVAFWIWAMTGYVNGVEFSPDGFQLRRFSFTKPVLSTTGFWKAEFIESDFSSELAALGVCPIRAPQTWHLAQDNRTSLRSIDRQADVLTNMLEARTAEGDWFWIQWSKQHPQPATRLWPLLQSLAFDQLYLVTPLVLRGALEHQQLDPQEFEANLRQVVCDELELMKEEYTHQKQSDKVQRMDTLLQKYLNSSGPLPQPVNLNPKEPTDYDAEEYDEDEYDDEELPEDL